MLTFNFQNDLRQELHSIFFGYGIKIPVRNDIYAMLLDYLTTRRKLILPKPREVYYSPVLENKLQTHSKKIEIALIYDSLERGKDVNCFQSKKIIQTRFHDHLSSQWNIYHFHLSTEKDQKSYFVKQTNELLFAYVNESKVIFLDTEKHSRGIFGDTKWFEILHDYFPETIEPYKDKKWSSIGPLLSAIERQQTWDNGFSFGMMKIRNSVYHSPGLGKMLSGHSPLVIKTADAIIRWLSEIEEQFLSNFNLICESFMIPIDMAQFKLKIGTRTFEIVNFENQECLIEFPQIFVFES